MMSVAAFTHPGMERGRNEDVVVLPGALLLDSPAAPYEWQGEVPTNSLFAVVDGMGGHVGGREASTLVGLSLASGCSDVETALRTINRELFDEMQVKPALTAMGSTVAGIHCQESIITVFNVGDSRVYRHVGGFSTILSVDDSGGAPGVLTQSLGGTSEPTTLTVHLAHASYDSECRMLVCSDGLTDVVDFADIQSSLNLPNPADAVMSLIVQCLDAGAPDNVSAIVVDWQPLPPHD